MKKPLARRAGFTLVEILVVIGIIMLLAAILFPTFNRAQENARQTSCASNLKQIYFAVQAYHADERRYPDSLMDLLPEGAKVEQLNPAAASVSISADKGTGYFKGGANLLVCPSDDTDPVKARSSYGALYENVETHSMHERRSVTFGTSAATAPMLRSMRGTTGVNAPNGLP
jgi:type II secretory pathway pseudopilin PulG